MFNPTRLKVQLKLAMKRLKMLQEKKTSLGQHQRRELAMLLEKGKVESARIRVEHIIRDDLIIEAMEIMELYCDILLARFGLLEQYKECDPGIAEAVNTIIWAAPRLGEAKELQPVRDQLVAKFGKEFMTAALENEGDVVSPRVYTKLQIDAPDPVLVERYLEEIAKGYHVKWVSDLLEHSEESSDEDVGGEAELEDQLQLPPSLEPPLLADSQAVPEPEPFELPSIPTGALPTKKATPPLAKPEDDFDLLAKRLAALKRK
ncbi:DUF292-domain-containing protein [Hesseltinella vesiculosa]|uniref:DUF292-domain-containing protein n=1 Tax=Hesseltinella vesiculosa TaxID=101127 RepID=A0A1X2GSA6_9FUNG|nr:DUF292-domain-containing protein [Hesseltinella vesiculosa]